MIRVLLLTLSILISGVGTIHAQDIDNRNAIMEGFMTVTPDQSAGQTFRAPTVERFLNSFSFQIGFQNGSVADFFAYLLRWDGTRAVGPILYQSPLMAAPTGNAGTHLHQVFFTPATPIELIGGEDYIAFLVHQGSIGSDSRFAIEVEPAGDYPDGIGLRHTTGDPFNDPWLQIPYDFSFTADFSGPSTNVVPEPASLALLGTGLFGLGLLARRRKQREEEDV